MQLKVDIVIKQYQFFALIGNGHSHPVRKWHRKEAVEGASVFRAHLERQTDKIARFGEPGSKKITQRALNTRILLTIPECSQHDFSQCVVALTGNRTPDVRHNSGATDFGDADRFARLYVKPIVITPGSIKTGEAT